MGTSSHEGWLKVSPSETVAAAVGRLFGAGGSGAEVVDRDLAIGQDRRAAVVLVDADGRLTLVLAFEALDDEALLATVDTMSFAKLHSAALCGHCSAPQLRADLPPAVWVVSRRASRALAERWSALDPERVRVFALVQVESRRGSADYLTEIALDARGRPPAGAARAPSFLERLSSDARPLGETIVERVRHLDEDVEVHASSEMLEWRVRNELIASLESKLGSIQGSIPGVEDATSIDCHDAAERFLEAVVERYLGVAESTATSASLAVAGQALLTAEELAAFDPTR